MFTINYLNYVKWYLHLIICKALEVQTSAKADKCDYFMQTSLPMLLTV